MIHWWCLNQSVRNLTLLCGQHHRAVHDHGIAVHRAADGVLRLTLSDGRTITGRDPIPLDDDPLATLTHATRHVTPSGPHTNGTGPLSLDDSLYVLLNNPPARPPAGGGQGDGGG